MTISSPGFSASTIRKNRRLPVLAAGAILGVLLTSAAWAQTALNSPVAAAATNNHAKGAVPVAPADALPGAKAREAPAPATRPAGDLQPNEALFDAINRGDISAARDALNRGADLSAVNLLGMTPTELSVDLNRNDITFLLLSMRGEDDDRGAPTAGQAAPVFAAAAKPVRAGKIAPAGKTASARTASHAPVAASDVVASRRFANDGGTPLPSAGFLGFGSRSDAN